MDDLTNMHNQWQEKPSKCSKCGGALSYKGLGEYVCCSCENIERDDFGKVRHFIEVNGPSTAMVINEGTGVPISKINAYLRQGRVEIPDGSGIYINCERCGTAIRYGRFCQQCAAEMSKQVKGYDMGERPKNNTSEMRFFGKNRRY